MGKGLGTSGALETGEGRAAFDAALEIFRAVRGRRLRQADRCFYSGNWRESDHCSGIVRRHPAEGFGRRKYWLRPGLVLGPILAAAPVPAEMRRRDRRRRLSRQEV